MDSAQGHKESDGTERPSSQAQRSHSQGPQGSPHWDLRGPVSVQPWGCGSVHGWNFSHTHIRPQRRGGEERTEAVSRKPARNVQTLLASAQRLRGEGSPSSTRVLSFSHLVWSPHVGAEPEKRCHSHDSLFSPKKSLRRRNSPEPSPSRAGSGGEGAVLQRSVGMLRARAYRSRSGLRLAHAWHRLDL